MSKAEKTKQFIIEKTAPIFNIKGYAGTSINDITDATGLTRGSIYGNFENKDEVALAAFDYNLGIIRSSIARQIEQKHHAVDKLKVYIDIYSNFGKLPPLKGGCPILNTAVEADDTHPKLRLRAADAVELWMKALGRIVLEGKENGHIKRSANAKEFAAVFIALIEGGIMITKVTGKLDGLKAALKHAEKLIKDIAA